LGRRHCILYTQPNVYDKYIWIIKKSTQWVDESNYNYNNNTDSGYKRNISGGWTDNRFSHAFHEPNMYKYIAVVKLLSVARDYNIPRSWSFRTMRKYKCIYIYIKHASPVSLSLINIFIRRKIPYWKPSPPQPPS